MLTLNESAFPTLTVEEIELLSPLSLCQEYNDGDVVFEAGNPNIDLIVVESGLLDIVNPAADNALIVTHEPGMFAGDIDLLTRRPAIVTGLARGHTRVLRVPGKGLSEVLIRIPRISEKLLVAFQMRREMLSRCNKLGLKVVGPGKCKHTTVIREFLYRNFVPFHWYEVESHEGQEVCTIAGAEAKWPLVQCNGKLLSQPTLRELATTARIWHHFDDKTVDLVIVGAGPAGITAAVYGASEGLSTLVLDSLGPGGQASTSSKIENFIGFPSGLSGTDLALRGVIQMLKFGAQLCAPVLVEQLERSDTPHGYHKLTLDCGAVVLAKTVMIATGMNWRKLEAENADRFERAGIYYACTSVEALLHDNTDVGVVGGGNSAGQAATFLAECCPGRTVHLFVRRQLRTNMSRYLYDRIESMPNIRVHEETIITSVFGEAVIEAVEINHKGQRSRLPLSGVFVFIGADPCTTWLPEDLGRDEDGFVLIGADAEKSGKWPLTERGPCALETTIPRILAVGDVRAGSTKRVGFAVGDGSQSIACVHELLAQ